MSRCQPRAAHVDRKKRGTLDKFLFSYEGSNAYGAPRSATAGVITRDELKSLRSQIGSGTQKTSTVSMIHKSELERIRKEVLVKEQAQANQEKMLQAEQKQQSMAAAKSRKQRMQNQDRERAANAPLVVKTNKFGENTLLSKAQEQMDEDYDDVKHMNQMVIHSKICTIRDRQLAENKALEENWIEEQKRLDLMMEIERLKAIQAEYEREERAADARKKGASVIIDQIQQRQVQRLKEEEILEREKVLMLQNIEKVKKEEAAIQEAKRKRVQIMNEEVKVANKNALSQKEAARKTEKDMDAKIAEFNRAKLEREEAKIREDARIKEEKEREIQRLRELQERAQDRQAELDQVRAQKAFEAAELQRRAELKAKQIKHEKDLNILHQARQKQFADNDARMKEEARVDREMYLKVVQRQKEQEEEERQEMATRRNAFLNYKHELSSQMNQNEELRRDDKHQQILEGKKNRLMIDQERNRIEMIKAQKLSGVQSLGIQDRYTADLVKKKPAF